MKHMNREEALIQRLLRKTRTIAVIGASPRPTRHSGEVVTYLRNAGYDVIPIRQDRLQVGGLPTYARLADVAGAVDLVIIFRRSAAAPMHVREAAAKRVDAVWLPPGVWSGEAEEEARQHELALIKDRCIVGSIDTCSAQPAMRARDIRRKRVFTSADGADQSRTIGGVPSIAATWPPAEVGGLRVAACAPSWMKRR
jgi:predicted CoA-binding protein